MTEILCGNTECRYLNGNICTACMIELDDDGYCLSTETYSNAPEYQEEYYIAVRAIDGGNGRARKQGKKITIGGEDFFTQSPPHSDNKHTYVTHGRTGYLCGTVDELNKRFDAFKVSQMDVVNVMNLPLVEFDETKRKYVYVQEREVRNED
ncbi:MAG: hypothetical protein HFE77_03205 [Clostridiales bacterium]|nr:hypothetical protein [Clostridiales bacterium]